MRSQTDGVLGASVYVGCAYRGACIFCTQTNILTLTASRMIGTKTESRTSAFLTACVRAMCEVASKNHAHQAATTHFVFPPFFFHSFDSKPNQVDIFRHKRHWMFHKNRVWFRCWCVCVFLNSVRIFVTLTLADVVADTNFRSLLWLHFFRFSH